MRFGCKDYATGGDCTLLVGCEVLVKEVRYWWEEYATGGEVRSQ